MNSNPTDGQIDEIKRGQYVVWHYRPDDGLDLQLDVDCRVVDIIGDTLLVSFKNRFGDARSKLVSKIDVSPRGTLKKSRIATFIWDVGGLDILKIEDKAGSFRYVVAGARTSWENDDDNKTWTLWNQSGKDTFVEACKSFPSWRKLPFFSLDFIHQDYKGALEQVVAECIESFSSDEALRYREIDGLNSHDWVRQKDNIENGNPMGLGAEGQLLTWDDVERLERAPVFTPIFTGFGGGHII
jgi:hypothetical protein